MSKYVCESAELVQEQGKNPYLRCTFKKKSTGIIMQSAGRPVVFAMSGSFFTADRKPDTAKNLAWCQQMAPQFVNQEADIDEFTVDCEPYYRIIEGALEKDSSGQPLVYNKITVRAFSEFDATTGVIQPIAGWDSTKRQGKRMLENGTAMYITVTKYKNMQAAKEAAATAQPAATFAANAAAAADLPM